MAVVPRTASGQHLLRVLKDREEALANLLERPGGAKALLRLCDGKSRWLGRVGTTNKPVVRVRLKRGVPGEVLDIQLRDTNSATVERVHYRCLAISSQDSIESTPREYTATWYAAGLFAAYVQSSRRPMVAGTLKSSKTARTVTTLKQPPGSTCRICGRRKLSREEYAWRRRNGYAVWRCQHRRPSPKRNRDLTQALSLVAVLTACALAAVL
jgi:hypothetical protein